MANQCVMCGAEMSEGGHVCEFCQTGAVRPSSCATKAQH